MRVEEVMSTPVITCSMADNLNVPAQKMWEADCGAIPVLDDDGKIAGILTDRDICMAAYTQGRPLHEVPVTGAMAKEVRACQPEESVDAAEHVMAASQVRRLPIVDGEGRPVGMVSMNDLARQVAATRQPNGEAQELVQTVAAVGKPRFQPGEAAPGQPAASG